MKASPKPVGLDSVAFKAFVQKNETVLNKALLGKGLVWDPISAYGWSDCKGFPNGDPALFAEFLSPDEDHIGEAGLTNVVICATHADPNDLLITIHRGVDNDIEDSILLDPKVSAMKVIQALTKALA